MTSLDAQTLVERMVEAGPWPPPDLLQQIVDAGDAAAEPLLRLLRARHQSGSTIASLKLAIGLLSVLGRPETIPDLIQIVEDGHPENSADAADAILTFGTDGFQALDHLCSNPKITSSKRAYLIDTTVRAAVGDPARSSRLANTLRPILEDAVTATGKERSAARLRDDRPPYDVPEPVESIGEDEGAIDDHPRDRVDTEEIAAVVDALLTLADPIARDTIMTAFDHGLLDESFLTPDDVVASYDVGSKPREPDPQLDWLSLYRDDYKALVEPLNKPAPAARARLKYRYQDRYDEGEPPPDVAPTEPIRRTGVRLGRNDPCWCGSGKKYKKCHLGKESVN